MVKGRISTPISTNFHRLIHNELWRRIRAHCETKDNEIQFFEFSAGGVKSPRARGLIRILGLMMLSRLGFAQEISGDPRVRRLAFRLCVRRPSGGLRQLHH